MQQHAARARYMCLCLLLALSCCCWITAAEPVCKPQVRFGNAVTRYLAAEQQQLWYLQCIRTKTATSGLAVLLQSHPYIPQMLCMLSSSQVRLSSIQLLLHETFCAGGVFDR